MRKAIARSKARCATVSQQDFVGLWSTAMWGLAAIYLLATFSPY